MRKLALFLISVLSLTLIFGACGGKEEASSGLESSVASSSQTESLETSSKPASSEEVESSEVSEEPEISESPEASEDPETSEDPEVSEEPETSEEPEVVTYTVTFDCGGIIQSITQKVKEGEKAQVPTLNLGEDYAFEGWNLDGEAFDFNTAITGDIVVTLVYSRLYTVTFDCGAWKGLSIPSQKVKEGEMVTLPNLPASQEYEFKAWLLNGVVFDETTPITADITLTLDCEVYGSIV